MSEEEQILEAINRATVETELYGFPLSPAQIRSLLEYREVHGPFKSLGELINVKGIGERTITKLGLGIVPPSREREKSVIAVGSELGYWGTVWEELSDAARKLPFRYWIYILVAVGVLGMAAFVGLVGVDGEPGGWEGFWGILIGLSIAAFLYLRFIIYTLPFSFFFLGIWMAAYHPPGLVRYWGILLCIVSGLILLAGLPLGEGGGEGGGNVTWEGEAEKEVFHPFINIFGHSFPRIRYRFRLRKK